MAAQKNIILAERVPPRQTEPYIRLHMSKYIRARFAEGNMHLTIDEAWELLAQLQDALEEGQRG